KKQFHIYRKQSDPDKVRVKECNKNKIDMAIEMLQRAWKYGIRAQYLLADSWFACEKLIAAVRSIGKGAVHYIGLAKMRKTKYEVRGKLHNARTDNSLCTRRNASMQAIQMSVHLLARTVGKSAGPHLSYQVRKEQELEYSSV
ncbi:hypothetical protein EVA_20833, partial [gut metagenome]